MELTNQAKDILTLVFAGGVGKFIVDNVRKILVKMNIPLSKWTIRLLTLPIAYLVLLVYSLVTKTPLHTGLIETVSQVVSVAMLSIAANEVLPKDKAGIKPTPPTPGT